MGTSKISIDYSEFAIPKPSKKRTKKRKDYTDIPSAVKKVVWERDGHRCIFCHRYVSVDYACCHFIPRSAGGLGIPENIFTACENDHREQDNGIYSKKYTEKAERHLKGIYGANWNKEKLIFDKWRRDK